MPPRTIKLGLLAVLLFPMACGGGAERCTNCVGGPEGEAGTVGTAGASGTTGTTGASGTTGKAGAGGTTGTAGAGGATGTAGGGGATGPGGRGGTTGAGGGGTTGSAGASGATGTAGASGTTGSGGRGATTGSAGASGTTGSAGASGTPGTAGAGGTSATAGAGGTSATAGTSGSGTAGSGGTSGSGGAAGAAGTVGVAGSGGNAGGAGQAGGGGRGGAGGTPQVIVSIDFIGGSTSTGGAGGAALVAAPAMAATEVAGFKPAANWNGAAAIMGTITNLVRSDGAATGASATWNSPAMGMNPGEWKNMYIDMPGDTRMMNGYLDPSAAATPATVTVSALPAAITAGGYDVYVYMAGNIPNAVTRTYQYAIGTTTFTVSQTGPSGTTFPGYTLAPAGGAGTYVVFRNLTAASFTLTATPGTGSQTRAPVNGLQIVSPTGS